MPSVQRAEEFHSLLGVHTIYVHQIQHAGLPYVGFAFGCTWDIEHGLGVLMHGSRVVEIGGEDTAFTGWRAEQDADSRGPKNVAPGSESMPESPRPSPNLPRWEVARQPSQKFDALSRDDGGKGPMNRLRAAHTWIGKGVAYLCLLAVVAFVLALLAALLFRWIRSW
ncbi:MAG TPA: hypothetical protein VFK05_28660 [Polyangiaceae bacterium]|nr:hypothetical protein [Polyangiaceae bacterium]